MAGLCNITQGMASLFLQLAFVAAVAETLLTLVGKAITLGKVPKTESGNRTIMLELDGLAKVLEALKGLPAWIAIFLAALALAWTAASAPHLCP